MWPTWCVVLVLLTGCLSEDRRDNDSVHHDVVATAADKSIGPDAKQTLHFHELKEEPAGSDLDAASYNEIALKVISTMKGKYQDYFKQKEISVRDRDIRLIGKKIKSCIEKLTHLKETDLTLNRAVMKVIKLIKIDAPVEIMTYIFESKELSVLFFNEVDHILTYMNSLSAWYEFVTLLYNRLSEYDVQRDNKKCIIDKNVVIKDWDKRKVSESTFYEYLTKCLRGGFQENYDEIKNITLDVFKIETVLKIVKIMTEDDPDILKYIEKTSLVISSRFIKTSSLKQIPSAKFSSLKSITMMALDKIFIDDSISMVSDQGVQVSIISPVWEVIGKQIINLNGTELPEKINSGTQNANGMGKPGRSGNTAGSFFGIGDTFINGGNLTISACGSNGGAGQAGRSGRHGLSSQAAPTLDRDTIDELKKGNISVWTTKGFKVTITRFTHNNISRKNYNIVKAKGKDCTDGEDSSAGGAGGFGGKAGNVDLIDLSDISGVRYINKNGSSGSDGRPGKAGLAGLPATIMTVTVFMNPPADPPYNPACFMSNVVGIHPLDCGKDYTVNEHVFGKTCINGNVPVNVNDIGREQPKEPTKIPMTTLVHNYTKFVKTNIASSMNEVNLWKFIYQCENDVIPDFVMDDNETIPKGMPIDKGTKPKGIVPSIPAKPSQVLSSLASRLSSFMHLTILLTIFQVDLFF